MSFFHERLFRSTTIAWAVTVFFLVLASNSSEAAEKIKIASIFAQSGVAAAGNLSAIQGVRFAVDELNKQGGLLGKELEVIEIDNHSTALYSRQAAEQAIKEGAVVVIGANWSSHSLAIAPILQEAQIPMISTFSTNPDVTLVGDYIFRVCFIDSFQGRIMANFAKQELHARKAAILINSSSRYSEGLADHFNKHFVAQGGQVVLEENYIQEIEDFSPYLEKVIAHQPDVLFVPGHIIDSALIIKQVREAGFTRPVLGGDGWGDSMYKYAGSALEGNYFSGHWHEEITAKKSRDFVKKYHENSKITADGGTALAYDAVCLFADAVRRAGTLDPAKIRDALATTDGFIGVTGKIAFNEFRNPVKPGIINKFDKGQIVYLKTILP